MPTLSIAGKDVDVGDEFLKLTHDQQNATVDEIAKSIGVHPDGGSASPPAPAGFDPLSAMGDASPITQDQSGQILDTLGKTWPARLGKGMIDSVKNAVTYPHDVYTGDKPLTTDDAIKFGLDASLLANPITPGSKLILNKALPDLAGEAALPAVTPAVKEAAQTAPAITGNEVIDAANRQGIQIPKAVATDSMALQRLAATLRNIPWAGDPLVKAAKSTGQQIMDRVGSVADAFGHGTPGNVANRMAGTLEGSAGAETGAAKAAAEAADRQALEAWDKTRNEGLSRIDTQEQAATDAARKAVGSVDPNDMGAALTSSVKANEQAAKANKDALYREADQPGQAFIKSDAVKEVGPYVKGQLDDAGRVVDPLLTPASSKMLGEIDNLSNLKLPGADKTPDFVRNTPQDPIRFGPPPQTLQDFIKKKGGIADEGGDLKAMGLNHLINNKDGMSLDGARQAAAEAGYLGPNIDDAMANTFTHDLLNSLENHPAYSVFDEGRVAERSALKDYLNNKSGQPKGSGWTPFQAPNIPSVDVSALQQVRKRLSGLSQAAGNDADRAAARKIMGHFDDWTEQSFDKDLYSGSPDALAKWKSAIAANADWRKRFGYNAKPGDDAGKLLNKIATADVTPQEVANWVLGSTQVGGAGRSARLIDQISSATGNDPEALNVIRGGVWNRLTENAAGMDAKASQKVADSIHDFLNGSGKAVADKLFDDTQRGVMKAYADTVRNAVESRKSVDLASKGSKPAPTEIKIGPMQQLANDVVGKSRKPDEAIYSAVDGYAKSGNRADLSTLASILRTIPQEQKGDLAGSMIRNMGVSPRTKEWSGDVFLSNWKNYTPGAKSLLFGTSGDMRTALDDLATISAKHKSLQQFANPSGTGQTLLGGGIMTGIMTEPVTTLATVLGGNIMSRALAKPATAKAVSRWAKAYERVAASVAERSRRGMSGQPITTTENAAYSGLRVAAKQLSQSLSSVLGVSVRPEELLRSINGPVGVRANDSSD